MKAAVQLLMAKITLVEVPTRKMASATATHKQVSFSVPYRTVSWLESGIIQDETGDCGLRVEWVLTFALPAIAGPSLQAEPA